MISVGTEVGVSPGDAVLDEDPTARSTLCYIGTQSPQKGTASPTQFSARVYCDQTAGWIKVPLGTVELAALHAATKK